MNGPHVLIANVLLRVMAVDLEARSDDDREVKISFGSLEPITRTEVAVLTDALDELQVSFDRVMSRVRQYAEIEQLGHEIGDLE